MDIDGFARDGGRRLMLNKELRDQVLKAGLKARELISHVTSAKLFLDPSDAFYFILEVAGLEDLILFQNANDALKSLAPDIDFAGLIEYFRNDDTIRKALILNAIPVPIPNDFMPFIYRCAMSNVAWNRCAFLSLLDRMRSPDMDPQLHENACQILEILANDPSPLVLCQWISPALHYLQDGPRLKLVNGIKDMIHHQDAEVRTAVALHFKEVFSVTTEVTFLLRDTSPRVMAALIPDLAEIENEVVQSSQSAQESIHEVFQCRSHFVRAVILRHFKKVPSFFIDDCITENSTEVILDVIRYLARHEGSQKFVIRIIQNNTEGSSWRKDYELLALPIDLLVKIGEDAFRLAASRVARNPLKLMKQAATVLVEMAKADRKYDQKLRKIQNELSLATDVRSKRARALLDSKSRDTKRDMRAEFTEPL